MDGTTFPGVRLRYSGNASYPASEEIRVLIAKTDPENADQNRWGAVSRA